MPRTRPSRSKRAAATLAFALLSASAREARADSEAWLWVENRVPLLRKPKPEAGRIDLRVFGDFRANRRSEGLGVVFGRIGPLFFLTDWLFVGTHGSALGVRTEDGRWQQQFRAELEPNFFFRLGDFAFNDRNRGEYRQREDARDFWFYRNMLRVSYAPLYARWIPYVFDEVLFNATVGEVAENRGSVGLGRMVGASTRVDLGYMVRSRNESKWVHDHVINLYFFFDVPRAAEAGERPAALPGPGAPAPAPKPAAPRRDRP